MKGKVKNKTFKVDVGIFSIIGYLLPVELATCDDVDKCYVWDLAIIGEVIPYAIVVEIRIMWFYTIRIIIK